MLGLRASGNQLVSWNRRALAPGGPFALDAGMTDPATDRHIQSIERPDPALWTYYLLGTLVVPPLFPIFLGPSALDIQDSDFRARPGAAPLKRHRCAVQPAGDGSTFSRTRPSV